MSVLMSTYLETCFSVKILKLTEASRDSWKTVKKWKFYNHFMIWKKLRHKEGIDRVHFEEEVDLPGIAVLSSK